jgi:hypothetical protein
MHQAQGPNRPNLSALDETQAQDRNMSLLNQSFNSSKQNLKPNLRGYIPTDEGKP